MHTDCAMQFFFKMIIFPKVSTFSKFVESFRQQVKRAFTKLVDSPMTPFTDDISTTVICKPIKFNKIYSESA